MRERSTSLNDKPYTVYTVERLRRRRRRRIVLWSLVGVVVLILAVGGGSYLWFYRQLERTRTDVSITSVGDTSPGAIGTPTGMDIILIGSDKRANNTGEETRSDTVMLVHADPDQDYLSILSLPRDLQVEIPDHGVDKLNAAYSIGGAELTIKTVEFLTKVDIEEYVEVDFSAFSAMTDSLGGVYVDVDRRYYNDDPQWELIKLSPGYQLLDGDDALDYVRFRHDLNYDFGRMDRQQRFLAALREQALGWNLLLDLPGMVSALCDHLRTTLDPDEIIELTYWGVRLGGDRIRQVSIVGDIQTQEDVSYVVPVEGAVAEAVDKLMTAPEKSDDSETQTSGGSASSDTTAAPTTSTSLAVGSFITDPEEIADSRLWKQIAAATPFRVLAPGYLPEGYAYVDKMAANGGAYEIVVGDNKTKPAVKMVYRLTNFEGEPTDQYMGIMETTWLDAPAAGGGTKVERSGITYTFVGTNQRTERIWWVKDDVLYWVSNTLSYVLNRTELLNVAQSMIPVSGGADE